MKTMTIRLVFSLSICLVQLAQADVYSASQARSSGDYDRAAAEFMRLAEGGDAKAQAHLGYMYYIGEGVPQSYAEAVKWYRKAAAQGDADAQYNLAVAYAFGEGTGQDYEEAVLWYRRAAEQGHAIAQYSLGLSYSYGEGVAQDAAEAAGWFKKSADQGYVRAQVLLGSKYHVGDGLPQDYAKAARWYRMAADRGDAAAQYNLGAMYRSGKGLAQDYNQARRWYRMAADQGYAAAQNELAGLERAIAGAARSRITSDQPAAGQPEMPELEPLESEPASAATEPALEEETEPLLTIDSATLLELDEMPAGAEIDAETSAAAAPEPQQEALEEAVQDSAHAMPDVGMAGEAIEEEAAAEPRRGFFSRLFGRKDKATETTAIATDGLAEDAELAGAEAPTTETAATATDDLAEDAELAAAEVLTAEVDVEQIDDVAASAAAESTAEKKLEQLLELEGIEPSLPEDSSHIEASIAETSTAPEAGKDQTQKKKSFFSRLFSRKDKAPPVEDVEEVETQTQAEEPLIAAVAPAETDLEIASEVMEEEPATEETLEAVPEEKEEEHIEPVVEEIAPEVTEDEPLALIMDIAAPAESAEEISASELIKGMDSNNEVIEVDTPAEEKKRPGLFARLFGKKKSLVEEKTVALLEPEAEETELTSAAARQEPYVADEAPQPVAVYAPEIVAPAFVAAQDEYGRGLEALENHEYADAFEVFRELADQGDAKAQFQLAALYYQGLGTEQDDEAAIDWYQRAARQGNAEAQYSLGNMFLMGKAVEQSDVKAAYWYEKASAQGHDAAGQNLANLARLSKSSQSEGELLSGEAIVDKADEVVLAQEKKGFFKRLFGGGESGDDGSEYDDALSGTAGAEQVRNSRATPEAPGADPSQEAGRQYELGLAYAFGEGAREDHALAFAAFMQSAEQGYAPAQYKVGAAYAFGEGVQQDLQQAAAWYQRAAFQGHAVAQRNLAAMYLDGKGVAQDKPRALAWYSLLADGGNVMDARRRDALEQALSWEEIQEAQRLKRELIRGAR